MSATYAPRGIYSCHRLVRPSLAISRISTCQQSIRPTVRVFTTSPWRSKDDTQLKSATQETKVAAAEPTKTSNVKKKMAVDPLLAEQTVSNKEQRKADWAIIKDMAHYLWPKDDFGTRFRVGLSVGLLVGAKVIHRLFCVVACHVNDIQGFERSSSLLFQIHRRFHEHRLCCCRWHCRHCRWRYYLCM
jgi:ATP-binding cassette subfamily B (MDR/TAP) protein 7